MNSLLRFAFFGTLLAVCATAGGVSGAAEYAQMLETDFRDAASMKNGSIAFLQPERLFFAPGDGASRALVAKRGNALPQAVLGKPLTTAEDFGYSLDLTRVAPDSTCCAGFANKPVRKISGMIFVDTQGRLLVFSGTRYESTGLKLDVGKRYRIQLSVNGETRAVTVKVPGLGSYQAKTSWSNDLDRFVVAPQPPKGNVTKIENLRIYRKPGRIAGKENGLLKAKVEIQGGNKNVKVATFTDGDLVKAAAIPVQSVVEFVFSKRLQAHSIQIYGGCNDYRKNPSGACAPKAYVVEGLCNGAWAVLAKVDEAPNVCKQDGLAEVDRFTRHDFKSMPLDRLRITFLKSHDTGKRMGGDVVPEKSRTIYLREVELLTDRDVVQQFQISTLLDVDFRLPVYRNADRAELTIVAKSNVAPLEGVLTLADPQKKVIRKQKISWKTGINHVVIDKLGSLPGGRYLMTLTVGEYQFQRLLRLERVAPIVPPAQTLQMTGKKFYFTPDVYTFAKCQDLEVKIGKTEMIEQVPTPSPDKLLVHGFAWYRAKDGRYIVGVEDLEFKGGQFGKPSRRYMAAKSIAGPFTGIDKLPPAERGFNPVKAFRPASFRRPPKGKMEIYDPAKHGKIDLGTLSYIYPYFKTDLGAVQALPNNIYVTGRTQSGQFVLMSGKPVFRGFGSYGNFDFDDGYMVNDNFGSMWLSPDGKECFWAQGQTVRRNAPYAVLYDNAQTCFRLVTVYSTRDGIHWQLRNTVTAPDEQDSWGAQHYGMSLQQMAYGDLYLVYLLAYDAAAQQIYLELVYSRDGVDFHRFKDRTPFVRTKKPGDWYFGHAFINNNFVREGKYLYQQAGYCTPLPHFAHEVVMNVPRLSAATGDMFCQRFDDREMSQRLPWFKEAGGYDGIAKIVAQGYYSSGVIKFRMDGWFGLAAGSKEGSFETHAMQAKGKLTANAEIAKDGYVELSLCGKDGKVLQTKRLTGDDVALPVFEKLPEGEFAVRGKLKNAMLYTLNFEKKKK